MAKESLFKEKLNGKMRHRFEEKLMLQMDADSYEDLLLAIQDKTISAAVIELALKEMGINAPKSNILRWRNRCQSSVSE